MATAFFFTNTTILTFLLRGEWKSISLCLNLNKNLILLSSFFTLRITKKIDRRKK
uniref:Uncharacterized protein n=1 Tax=Anguilla anguilla TaxID=7936 RepID=A0A0E9RFE8_ANGAN